MHPRNPKLLNSRLQPQLTQAPTKSHGFALPLIVIAGMFLMVGGMAMMVRTFGAFRGSIRSSQHIQAQEIAETGMAKVINQLNTTHRYLWLNCHRHDLTTPAFDPASSCENTTATSLGNWGAGGTVPSFPAATCSQLAPDTYAKKIIRNEIVTEKDNSNDVRIGDWRLDSYTYFGNNLDGGEGLLRVTGRMTNADGTQILANATIEQRVQVRGKPCGAARLQRPTAHFSARRRFGVYAAKGRRRRPGTPGGDNAGPSCYGTPGSWSRARRGGGRGSNGRSRTRGPS